jgi:radical SAM superfamily enzyme YgiQ (UPF0313 family)
MVGISAMTPNYPAACEVAQIAKQSYPEIPLIIGGYHPSALPEETLGESCFDVVVIGEGEEAIVELADCFCRERADLSHVPGIAYKDGNGFIQRTAPRPVNPELDRLPLPAREGFHLSAYPVLGSLLSSRGCPRRCVFCTIGLQPGRARLRSISAVLEEIETLKKAYGVREFFFHDDNFSADKKRTKELCRALRDAKLEVKWGCELAARDVDVEMAGLLVEAGCNHLLIGAESGNAEVLKSTRKGIRLEDTIRAVQLVTAAGMPSITCSFIIGHPTDTEATVRDTLRFALYLKEIGATKIRVGAMTPFPGTAIYHSADSLGVRILTRDWAQYVPFKVVMETEYLSKQMIASFVVEGLLLFGNELERCNG